MEHHVSWFTALLNQWLGGPVGSLLNSIGVHPHDPAHPIPDLVAMSFLVVILGMLFVLWLKPRLSVDRPGAMQQCMEMLLTNPMGVGIRDLLDQNAGHHGRHFIPVVGSISVFILLSNLISVVPGLNSPTANPAGPLACAVLTFVYYNWQGVRHAGAVGYLKHFAGPVWWLAWLIFPVEIISHTARLLSLTVRLYANMFSSELIYLTILGLLVQLMAFVQQKSALAGYAIGVLPALLPIVFILLHVFVAVMQTFVFTILPSIYLGMATSEEH